MKKILAITLMTLTSICFSQKLSTYLEDSEKAPRAHNVDMLHLLLDVQFDTKNEKVIGKVTHTFQPLQKNIDTLFLDAPGITIHTVNMNQINLKFTTNSEGVTIYFPEKLDWNKTYSITINYEVNPKKGIYFIGWNDPKQISRKQIWTQGQATDHRYWIPMYDGLNDKVTTELKITFDKQYNVLSNGNLISKKEDKGNQTISWHYKLDKPHPNYLIMLAIGDYKIHTMQSKRGVKLNLWYYPDWEDRVKYAYMYSDEMMDFMEKETGVLYPWGNLYSQVPVQDFMYGAMENTTATVFGDFSFVDQRAFHDHNYINVNTHELAHQWFGDLVTARSPAHHWLQESFATYYGALFEKFKFGEDYYAWVRKNQANSAFSASQRNDFPIAHSEAGSERYYPKGALVLAMLKYVVGEEEFNKSIKTYLERHAFRNAESSDLLYAFHETLGVDLFWFWEQWIYKGGEPHFQVSYSTSQRNGESFTNFTVQQIHSQKASVGLFKMPIVFQVHYTDGSYSEEKVWIEEKTEFIAIKNPENKPIAFTLFDPNNQILKQVNFTKSLEELLLQAEKAPFMIDRWWAIVQLRNYPLANKRDIFMRLMTQNQFHAIHGEILYQVVNKDSEMALLGLKSNQNEVRKATVNNLSAINEEQKNIILNYFTEPNSSYDLLSRSLELLIQYDSSNIKTYLDLSSEFIGVGRSFRIKWLELGIEYGYHKTLFTEELIDLTSVSYEFRTRINAMDALLRLGICNATIASNVLQASRSNNRRLAGAARRVIHEYSKTNSFKRFY